MKIDYPAPESYLAKARGRVLHRIDVGRRVRVGAIAGGSVLALAAVTGGALIATRVPKQEAETGVICYAHDDLSSRSATVAMATATPSPGAVVPGATTGASVDKAELCALAWRGGLGLDKVPAGLDPNTSTIPVPELAYCRLDNGMTGGFPVEAPSTTTAEVCDRLGLPVDAAVG